MYLNVLRTDLWPGHPVIDTRLFAVAILLCSVIAGGVAAEPIADSRGTWTGAIGERSSAWSAGTAKIELRVEGGDSRFSVDFTGPGGPLLASEFQAGNRKDVFDPPAAKGFMSLFARPRATADTLNGKPLLWARRTNAELIVYRLELQGGPYRLDRLVLRPAGDRLDVVFERREHDRAPERFAASLARQRP
jgi:hypothetical protein